MYINDVYPSNSKITKWIQKENCPSQVSNGQIKEEFKSVFSGKQPVLEFMEELDASSGKDAGINHKKIVSYSVESIWYDYVSSRISENPIRNPCTEPVFSFCLPPCKRPLNP